MLIEKRLKNTEVPGMTGIGKGIAHPIGKSVEKP